MNLSQDLHIHSFGYSRDATSTMLENIVAAEEKGMTVIGLVDHVRADSGWLASRVEEFSQIRVSMNLEVLLGVEAKILNRAGEIDVPANVDGVDFVAIADHRFPSESGPLDPAVVKKMINRGEIGVDEAIDTLITATINSLSQVARLPYPPILVHFLSLLPKIGLLEEMVTDQKLQRLGDALIASGALLEANEKWNCPSHYITSFLAENGVPLVAGSDAHSAVDIGAFPRVRDLIPLEHGMRREREEESLPQERVS